MNLVDLTDILMSNLEEIENSNFISDNLKNIECTQISYLEYTFKDILAFYNENHRWPEFDYILSKASNLIKYNDTIWSIDYLIQWNNAFNKEVRNYKAKLYIEKDQPEKAIEALTMNIEAEDLPKLVYNLNAYDRYKTIEASPTQGLYFGIPEVDSIYKYCTPGTTNLIAAPPKNGKTTVAFNSLYKNLMSQEVNLAYFCLELTTDEMAFNLISIHSKKMQKPLSAFRLKSQELNEREQLLIKEVEEDFEKNKKGKYVFFTEDHMPQVLPSDYEMLLKQIISDFDGKLDGLYTDYLQEMQHYRPPGLIGDGKSIMNYWVRWHHTKAKKYNYTQFLLSQINREGTVYLVKNRTVNNSLLAEANQLERACARSIVVLSDDGMRESNQMEIFFLHHRNGICPSGSVKVYADFAHFDVGSEEFSGVRTLKTYEELVEDGLFD